jgi:hypothetical protein
MQGSVAVPANACAGSSRPNHATKGMRKFLPNTFKINRNDARHTREIRDIHDLTIKTGNLAHEPTAPGTPDSTFNHHFNGVPRHGARSTPRSRPALDL